MKKQSISSPSATSRLSRRLFIASTLKAGVAAAAFPAIVPASVFGKYAPSNRINIGAIGTGRISRIHDLPGIWKYDQARIIAVLIHHIVMKLKRKVYWDPVAEKFKNDDEANRMLSRPQRAPYLVV